MSAPSAMLAKWSLTVAVLTAACTPTATPELFVGTITVATASPQPPPQTSGGSDCDNEWFPSDEDATWESVGTNNVLGDYQSTATVIDSRDDGFTIRTLTSTSFSTKSAPTPA